MSIHAFMSPSFAHIGYKCPAAALRSFQVKQRMELLREIAVEYYGVKQPIEVMRLEKILEEDTEAADEGTAFHVILEDALNDLTMKKSQIIRAIKDHPQITKGSKDDPWLHGRLCDIIQEQRKFIKGCDGYEVEKKIKVKGLPQFGTTDLVAWKNKSKTLFVKDLKGGRVEVSPKDNEQLFTYAIGVLDEVDENGSGWDKFNKVQLEILGLRWDSKPVTITTYELQKFKLEVMYPAFMNAYSIAPKAKAGNHCQYCAGKIHCKAWQEKFNTHLNDTYSDEDVDDLPTPQLVELWKLCKQAENLMKSQLGPEIMQRFDSFDEPTGVKRVSGRKKTDYKVSEQEVVKRFKSKVKNVNLLYKQELLTPTQLQAQLNLKDEDIEDITETTVTKPYLML